MFTHGNDDNVISTIYSTPIFDRNNYGFLYPVVIHNIAMENGPVIISHDVTMTYLLRMVILCDFVWFCVIWHTWMSWMYPWKMVDLRVFSSSQTIPPRRGNGGTLDAERVSLSAAGCLVQHWSTCFKAARYNGNGGQLGNNPGLNWIVMNYELWFAPGVFEHVLYSIPKWQVYHENDEQSSTQAPNFRTNPHELHNEIRWGSDSRATNQ